MSKYFECKACKERFNSNMESSNKGYCHICNEFFMKKHLAELKAKLNSYEEFYKTNGFKSKDDFLGYVVNTMLNKEDKANKIRELKTKNEKLENRNKKLKNENHDVMSKNADMEYTIFEYESYIEYLLKERETLNARLEEVEGQYAYECECNKQFVECQNENKRLKAENEKLKFKIEEATLTTVDGQEYDELKAENERLEKEKEIDNAFLTQELHKNCYLTQQLKEKDKEIERLRNIKINEFNVAKKQIEYQSTKQVCEKIRERYNLEGKPITDAFGDTQYGYVMVSAKDLSKFLDQIERGENNDEHTDK